MLPNSASKTIRLKVEWSNAKFLLEISFMTVFATRKMNVTEWALVQDRIGELQLSMAAPHDLMMLSSDSADISQQQIYIGLPNRGLLAHFSGFKEIPRDELPDYMDALVVREDGFKERFPDIAAKRRSKLR